MKHPVDHDAARAAFETWAVLGGALRRAESHAFYAGWRARGEADVKAVAKIHPNQGPLVWQDSLHEFICDMALPAIRALDAPAQKEDQRAE